MTHFEKDRKLSGNAVNQGCVSFYRTILMTLYATGMRRAEVAATAVL